MTHVFFPLIRLFVTFTYDLRTLFPANDSQQLDMSLVWTLCINHVSPSPVKKYVTLEFQSHFCRRSTETTLTWSWAHHTWTPHWQGFTQSEWPSIYYKRLVCRFFTWCDMCWNRGCDMSWVWQAFDTCRYLEESLKFVWHVQVIWESDMCMTRPGCPESDMCLICSGRVWHVFDVFR